MIQFQVLKTKDENMFFIVITFLFLGRSKARIENIDVSRTDEKLTNCAVHLINSHIHNRSFLAYSHEEYFVTNILKQARYNFVVFNLNENNDFLKIMRYKYFFYVLITERVEDVNNFFAFSYHTVAWNPRANILVIYLGEEDVHEIFKIAWKFLSLNVSVLTRILEVFTYFPIAEGNCGGNITKKLIHTCANGANAINVFPVKLFMYFHDCPLRVLPIKIEPYVLDLHRRDNPGYEVLVVREIAFRLKLSLVYVSHPFKQWGTKLSDGTYTDMYKYLFEKKTDIMVGMILANESYAEDFEETYPHSEGDLRFHVPTPLVIEGWKNFIIIFEKSLWFGFGIALTSTMLAWWIIGKSLENSEGFDNLGNCLFKVLCVIFSCFSTQPSSWMIRYIYILWTVYSFIITVTYTSVLIGFLTKPSYEREIATTTDMVNSKLKYGGLYVIRYIFNEEGNPSYLTLYDRFVNCPLSMECTNRTAFKRDFGVIKNTRQISYFTPKLYTHGSGRPMIQKVKDITVPQHIWLQTVKGFIYRSRVNEIIVRLRENGLVFKWDEDATTIWKKSIEVPPSVIPLTINHLKFAFICLFIGLLLAIIAFLLEIAYICGINKENSNQNWISR